MPSQARSATDDEPACSSSRSVLSTNARQPIGRSAATARAGRPVSSSSADLPSPRSKQLSTETACSAKYGQKPKSSFDSERPARIMRPMLRQLGSKRVMLGW